jgi:serine/threonine protein kinase
VGAVPASAGVQETTALLDTLDGFSDDRSLGRSHDLRVTGPSVVTVTDSFVGTPAYMAPELFSGGGADARTDQFAFCVSLYEAMYGQRPFRGATTRELAEEVLAGNVLPAPHRTRIPRWVHSIIERGLRVDPADRHPSIQSMLAAIAFTAKIMWD